MKRIFGVCGIVVALSSLVFAQDGVSSAGAARIKYLSGLGVIPSSREVFVEDFVNYHRHEIGRPKAGEAVALDVRWGSEYVQKNGAAVLQIGLSTSLAHDKQQLRPINLCVVLDVSGSMGQANKLTRAKSALLTFVSQLRPTDILSVVIFDSEARVLYPAQKLGDGKQVKELISGLEPGSSTNIHAGLMLGYKEASKNQKKEMTNRVVLLTDGIANVGVTEPESIAKDSKKYNDKGIDLSTIGLGLDIQKDMLATLAKSGRGLFHFIADAEDINKVFVNEIQSLISPVATEPNLEIEFGNEMMLDRVFGYEPKYSTNRVRVNLGNLNSGATEVVLLQFRPTPNTSATKVPVKVKLTYYDLERKKTISKTERSFLTFTNEQQSSKFSDRSVEKNYTIGVLAQAIRDMASACEQQKFREAENVLNVAIAKTKERYPNLEDVDIKRTLTSAVKYQEFLHKENLARAEKGGGGLPRP